MRTAGENQNPHSLSRLRSLCSALGSERFAALLTALESKRCRGDGAASVRTGGICLVRSPSAFPNFSPLIRCAFVELLRGARERWWLGEARFCIDFRRYTAVSSDCQSRSCADSRTRSALRDPWGRNTGLSRHSPRTESAPLLPRRHSGSRTTPA